MRRIVALLGFALGAAALVAFMLVWSPASAAPEVAGSFIVDRHDDTAAVAAQGCDFAVANDCSLRGAVIKANANPGSTVYLLQSGTYTLTIAKTGANDATSGDLNVTAPMTITAVCPFPPCSPTVVLGGPGWDDSIISSLLTNVRLVGLTISGGSAQNGGGVHAGGGVLTMTNGVVSHNTATGNGGGVYLGGNARLFMDNTTIAANSAGYGGGLSLGYLAQARLNGVTLTANSAYTWGGGIEGGRSWLDMSGSTLQSNQAGTWGGGIFTGNYMTLTVDASAILSNSAQTSAGGGIYHGLFATATVTGTLLQGNSASTSGGGIYNAGDLHLRDVTVRANSANGAAGIDSLGTTAITSSAIISNVAATLGGGIVFHNLLSMENSTLSHNRAGLHGGGLYASTFVLTATLRNTTVAYNVADADGDGTGNGGGLNGQVGPIVLFNSIVANNVDAAPGGSAPDCTGQITSQGYNLIGTTAGCTLVGDPTGNIIGRDPLLGPLRNNGGPTWTHALLPGSPAMDTAHPLYCPLRDQRGVLRPQNGTGLPLWWCDIGSYEYNGPTVRQLFLPLIRR